MDRHKNALQSFISSNNSKQQPTKNEYNIVKTKRDQNQLRLSYEGDQNQLRVLNSFLKNKAQTLSSNDISLLKPKQNGGKIYKKTQPNLIKASTSTSQSRDDWKHVSSESTTSNQSQIVKLNQVQDCKEIKEEELQRYLLEEPALHALYIDIPADQIEQAYKEKLKRTGTAFASTGELIEAIFQLEKQKQEAQQQTFEKHGEELIFVDRKTLEELEMLKQEKMCKICLDAQVGIVFVPCGHLITCVECSQNIKTCPMCRAEIQSSIKTFFS